MNVIFQEHSMQKTNRTGFQGTLMAQLREPQSSVYNVKSKMFHSVFSVRCRLFLCGTVSVGNKCHVIAT